LGQQQTVLERLDTYEKAWEGITAQPLLGNGTGSFGQRYVYRSVNEPGWVGNLELHLLYDSGLIGLAGFALFTGVIGGRAARAYRRSRDPLLRGTILALGGGLLSLLVAYQATEATWLAFTWVHLGLLAAATAIAGAVPRGLIKSDPSAPPSHSEAIRQKKIINTPLLNLDSSSGK
jgi:O-antigen ligase